METETVSNIVLIEWDGGRPPTRWYNRLHKLGLNIRGDKEISPLARREGFSGVVMQEGAMVVTNESEARVLAHLAREMGAKAVTVGQMVLSELLMTKQDQVALEHVSATLGRRGRPMGANTGYSVTCLDEMHTYQYTGTEPVNCKRCGSFNIVSRIGNQPIITDIYGGNLAEKWLNTRFVTGSFEEPEVDRWNPDAVNPKPVTAKQLADRAIDDLLNSAVGAQIATAFLSGLIDVEYAMRIMDCAFGSLKLSNEKRQTNRIIALTEWLRQGGSEDNLKFTAKAGEVDVLDVYVYQKDVFAKMMGVNK